MAYSSAMPIIAAKIVAGEASMDVAVGDSVNFTVANGIEETTVSGKVAAIELGNKPCFGKYSREIYDGVRATPEDRPETETLIPNASDVMDVNALLVEVAGEPDADPTYERVAIARIKSFEASGIKKATYDAGDAGDANDVGKISIPNVTVTPKIVGDVNMVDFEGEAKKDDLANLTEVPADDPSYSWAEDVAFAYAYFALPEGADYVNFGDQVSVPNPSLIKLDGTTTDGQTVEIDGVRHYKMVIQFAHKPTGGEWSLSVGSNNTTNIVKYVFTAGTVKDDVYVPMQTYKITLDYSKMTIVE